MMLSKGTIVAVADGEKLNLFRNAGEDGFSAGIVRYLNQQVLSGKIEGLGIIAAPRALGEMRKHYHKALSAIVRGEISKDLTGHSAADVESAVASA